VSWKGEQERKQPVLRSWRNHGNCGVSSDEIISSRSSDPGGTTETAASRQMRLSFPFSRPKGGLSLLFGGRASALILSRVTFTLTSVLYCSLASSSLSGQVLLCSNCIGTSPLTGGSEPAWTSGSLLRAYCCKRYNSCSTIFFVSLPQLKFMHFPHIARTLCYGKLFCVLMKSCRIASSVVQM
jgi:hypothetical protein